MKDTDLAYLAGVIDSDGCIGVRYRRYGPTQRDYFYPMVDIKQVSPEACLLARELGGHIEYIKKAIAPNRRRLYRWEASSRTAASVLRLLLPYLRIKREQALNAIALSDARPPLSRKGVTRGAPLRTVEEAESFRVYYERAKELNRVGVHSGSP